MCVCVCVCVCLLMKCWRCITIGLTNGYVTPKVLSTLIFE